MSRSAADRAPHPALAGFLAIVCFGVGGLLGSTVADLLETPTVVRIQLAVSGAVFGYYLGRTALRRLYTHCSS